MWIMFHTNRRSSALVSLIPMLLIVFHVLGTGVSFFKMYMRRKGFLFPRMFTKHNLLHTNIQRLLEMIRRYFLMFLQIPDAMLSKLDLTNPMLIAYLSNIKPNVEIGVLLPKGIKGTSK